MKKTRRVMLVLLVGLAMASGVSAAAASSGPFPMPGIAATEGDRPALESASDPVVLPQGVSKDWWSKALWNLQVLESPSEGSIDVGATPAVADWSAQSDQSTAAFGKSVSTAGDVNGDDYDDVIVGSFFYSSGGVYRSGRAYLFLGSASGLSTTPDRIIEPPVLNANAFFGQPVATAGDVNDDGYDEIIIGMQNYEGGGYAPHDEGAAFVWYGSENGLGTSYDWMCESEQQWAHFGLSLGTAGDVDGDGYDDIIVGAYCPVSYVFSKAFVWLGSETGLGANGTPANADWTATGDAGYDGFGNSVGTAGDVNGDGYDDVYVGACVYDHPEVDEGAVFVWHGSETGLGPSGTMSNADWMAEGNQASARFGGPAANGWGPGSTATAGDVNGDGYDDLIIGSAYYDLDSEPPHNEGKAFLYYGSSSGLGDDGTPDNADWTAEVDQGNAHFGEAVGSAGDVNGDGYDDIIIGALFYDVTVPVTLTDSGAAFIWYGPDPGMGEPGSPANANWRADGSSAGAHYGISVASAGDVNGDYLADVVVGASPSGNTADTAGWAYAYHGRLELPIEGLAAANSSPTPLGLSTTFTATVMSLGYIDYTWALDDGSFGAGAVLSHTYSYPDIYTVVVTASNSVSEVQATTIVTVEEAIAGLYAVNDSPTRLGSPTTFTATVSSGSSAVSYLWSFDDGTFGSGAVASHTYLNPGTYTAVATATNWVGEAEVETSVTVQVGMYLPTVLRSYP